MSTYQPLNFPGEKLGFTAGATITGGQLVYLSSANTVSPTTAATSAWIGVAENDATSGLGVTVYCEGVHLLTASGSISAGDLVVAAASGQVATIGTVTTANSVQVVGKALNAATNGNPVTVRLIA